MNNLILTIDNSLDISLCDSLIKLFNDNEDTDLVMESLVGTHTGNVNKTVRNNTYFNIKNKNDEILEGILRDAFKVYTKFLSAQNQSLDFINNNNMKIKDTGFMLNKYKKNTGFYTTHTDFNGDNFQTNGYRIVTYIWYLNDVLEGGETEFIDGTKVKAERGKLLFFPSTWAYSHTGNKPLSSDKYIIVGWFQLYK